MAKALVKVRSGSLCEDAPIGNVERYPDYLCRVVEYRICTETDFTAADAVAANAHYKLDAQGKGRVAILSEFGLEGTAVSAPKASLDLSDIPDA